MRGDRIVWLARSAPTVRDRVRDGSRSHHRIPIGHRLRDRVGVRAVSPLPCLSLWARDRCSPRSVSPAVVHERECALSVGAWQAIGGIALLILAVLIGLETRRRHRRLGALLSNGIRVIGTVVWYEGGTSESSRMCTIEFTADDSAVYRHLSVVLSARTHQVASRIPIVYNPTDPKIAVEDTWFNRRWPVLSGVVFGSALAAAGLALLVAGIRR